MANVIRAVGKQCPIPVVLARKALAQAAPPETLEVLVDNDEAVENLTRLAVGCRLPVRTERREGDVRAVIMEVTAPVRFPQEEAAAESGGGDSVVVIASDRMGDGEEALGRTLMKGFVYALCQTPRLPRRILFYNTGARLTCQGSESLEDLRFLSAQGVEILTCGTCLDYYGLKETLAVGGVTNLYAIAEMLTAAGRIIRP